MAVDFASVVVERSRTVPVVVDFWAEWCGPCRILGPLIEELAAEAGGRWELVKVDTEEQPELAEEHGIRGIPAVKMFHHGTVVAEFVGALPREEIRRWLGTHLPDERVDRLKDLLARWEAEGGRALAADLEAFVAEQPDLPEARIGLALAVVADAPGRARELLAAAGPEPEPAGSGTDVESLADLMECAADQASSPAAAHVVQAQRAFAGHDLDATLGHLVDAAMADKHYADDLSRRASVALFRLLGHDHELTREHQRRLAMALHS